MSLANDNILVVEYNQKEHDFITDHYLAMIEVMAWVHSGDSIPKKEDFEKIEKKYGKILSSNTKQNATGQSASQNNSLFLILSSTDVEAFCVVKKLPTCSFIDVLITQPRSQNKGLASGLLAHVTQLFKNNPILLHVAKRNEEKTKRLLDFYKKNGFIITKETTIFYEMTK